MRVGSLQTIGTQVFTIGSHPVSHHRVHLKRIHVGFASEFPPIKGGHQECSILPSSWIWPNALAARRQFSRELQDLTCDVQEFS